MIEQQPAYPPTPRINHLTFRNSRIIYHAFLTGFAVMTGIYVGQGKWLMAIYQATITGMYLVLNYLWGWDSDRKT